MSENMHMAEEKCEIYVFSCYVQARDCLKRMVTLCLNRFLKLHSSLIR